MKKREEAIAMKRKWRNEDPHHFMDKAALRERKAYMQKMRMIEKKAKPSVMEGLMELFRSIFGVKKN